MDVEATTGQATTPSQAKPLRWYDFISINLFWLGMNVRNTAIGSVFTPYLVAKFAAENVRNTVLGAVSTAGLVIAMLVQPAAGLMSDRSTSRFGRRRPYIFVGTLFDLVFIAAIAASGSLAMLLARISHAISTACRVIPSCSELACGGYARLASLSLARVTF